MSEYHPTVHTNIHDVVGVHVHHKGRVWKDIDVGDSKFDLVKSTDIVITMEGGQKLKLTMFHQPGVVPTFSSYDQEQAEDAAAKAEADAATDAIIEESQGVT